MAIRDDLNNLAYLQSQVDMLRIDHNATKRALIPPPILEQLDDMDVEFKDQIEAAEFKIKALTDDIKAAVEIEGKTVHGDHLMAVYSPGGNKWDTKGLEAFAMAHPVLNQFKKPSKPSVSIKAL